MASQLRLYPPGRAYDPETFLYGPRWWALIEKEDRGWWGNGKTEREAVEMAQRLKERDDERG